MGGTGTYPFLVGLGWWEGGGLEVEQLFMREYSEERSVLAALAERLAERPVLVTFNGKSFDWPLLETRYRMTRSITPPVLRAHLDFLHPARNLWRLRLGSGGLSPPEPYLLGWGPGAALLPARHWHGWPSVTGMWILQGRFGKACWVIPARGTRLTSSWPSTLNIKHGSRGRPSESCAMLSLNSGARTSWA